MVEVTALDGTKQLWAVAAAHAEAIAVVEKIIPAGSVAALSNRRLPMGQILEGMQYGEARRVEP